LAGYGAVFFRHKKDVTNDLKGICYCNLIFKEILNFAFISSMKKVGFPDFNEYAVYYDQMLQQVPKDINVLVQLQNNSKKLIGLLKSLPEEKLHFAYQSGKWTIKDILQHITDTERVFTYRAMRFSRCDKTPMPFFDEMEFAKMANAGSITLNNLIKEYLTGRKASIAFFNNADSAKQKRTGIASNAVMSVRACAWIICAHEQHHIGVIRDRYLV
jgi:uncharacterized damage-inducible protein DinB